MNFKIIQIKTTKSKINGCGTAQGNRFYYIKTKRKLSVEQCIELQNICHERPKYYDC